MTRIMRCPKCGRVMKRYKTENPNKQMWGCKMHYGKMGVWITIEGLKYAGRAIPDAKVREGESR